MSLSKNELILLANKGREEFEERVWNEDTKQVINAFEKNLGTFGAKLAMNWGLTLDDIYKYDIHIHNHLVLSAKEVDLEPLHFVRMCIAHKIF